MNTITGRVVYDRKKHFMALRDALRILKSINNNYAPGEKGFGDWFGWRAVARIAANNAALLGPYEFRNAIPIATHFSTKTGVFVEEHYRQLAYFVHYILVVSSIVDRIAPKLPFVAQVWEFGKPILDWAVKEADRKLGSWRWDEKTGAPIFF